MAENRSRFVLLCQQTLAFAMVFAFAAAGMGVVDLQIVSPRSQGAADAVPAPGALVSAAPVRPDVRSVALDGVDRRGLKSLPGRVGTGMRKADRGNVLSAPETVSGYATVGVTWAAGSGLTHDEVLASVRTKRDGVWSDWSEMHYDETHQADPTEGDDVRDGTDAVVVGAVDKIQVRVVTSGARAPEDMTLAIVDPGENVAVEADPEIDAAELSSTAVTTAGGLSAPKPQIFSRAQWGADERMRDKRSLRYGTVNAGFVHHTVNSNGYSKSQVPSILRGIYAFHTQSRGWSDIGYNFLVDRFGQIWEGRYGGVDKAVVGAHTYGYNDYSFAMSAIGNFDTAAAPAAMLDAYGRLMAWKLALHGVDASATKQRVGRGTFPAINGHRDAGSTACPGRYLYAKLPQIREQASRLQKSQPAPEPAPEPAPVPVPEHPSTGLDANISGSHWPDLVVRDGASKRMVVVRTAGQMGFAKPASATEDRWSDKDVVAVAGDITGDGRTDFITREGGVGTRVHPGREGGTFGPERAMRNKLHGLSEVAGVGDLNQDGLPDLVGVTAKGRLVLLRGRADGLYKKRVTLADDWSAYDLTAGAGDFDGDGRPDVVAYDGSGLVLFPGTAGGLGRPRAVAGARGDYDLVAGGGDLTGDKRPDLVVRDAGTRLVHVLAGDGAGGVETALGGWPGFRKMSWLAVGGQLHGSAEADLLAIKRNGAVKMIAHNGRRNIATVVDTGIAIPEADLVVNVGDWNGDGRGDVMTRENGSMYFWAGKRQGHFEVKVLAGENWGGVRSVTPVGDATGDGFPDVLIQGAKGAHRLVPSDGSSGFGERRAVAAPADVLDQVGLDDWDGSGGPDTAVRRADGSLWLLGRDGDPSGQLAADMGRFDWVRGLGDLDVDGRPDLVARDASSGDLYVFSGRKSRFAPPRLIASGYDRYDLG